MPARVRECWNAGGLSVSGYTEGEEPRGGIEVRLFSHKLLHMSVERDPDPHTRPQLVMQITPTLPLSLVLTPCDDPPFSMADLLSHVRPSTPSSYSMSSPDDAPSCADDQPVPHRLSAPRRRR